MYIKNVETSLTFLSIILFLIFLIKILNSLYSIYRIRLNNHEVKAHIPHLMC